MSPGQTVICPPTFSVEVWDYILDWFDFEVGHATILPGILAPISLVSRALHAICARHLYKTIVISSINYANAVRLCRRIIRSGYIAGHVRHLVLAETTSGNCLLQAYHSLLAQTISRFPCLRSLTIDTTHEHYAYLITACTSRSLTTFHCLLPFSPAITDFIRQQPYLHSLRVSSAAGPQLLSESDSDEDKTQPKIESIYLPNLFDLAVPSHLVKLFVPGCPVRHIALVWPQLYDVNELGFTHESVMHVREVLCSLSRPHVCIESLLTEYNLSLMSNLSQLLPNITSLTLHLSPVLRDLHLMRISKIAMLVDIDDYLGHFVALQNFRIVSRGESVWARSGPENSLKAAEWGQAHRTLMEIRMPEGIVWTREGPNSNDAGIE